MTQEVREGLCTFDDGLEGQSLGVSANQNNCFLSSDIILFSLNLTSTALFYLNLLLYLGSSEKARYADELGCQHSVGLTWPPRKLCRLQRLPLSLEAQAYRLKTIQTTRKNLPSSYFAELLKSQIFPAETG